MKKIIAFVLLIGLVMSFAACAAKEDTQPEITLQEVYDAGKDYTALLGDHESVYVLITSNGTVIEEEYLSEEYAYSFFGEEYMDMGFEFSSLVTDHSEYICMYDIYTFNITISPNGMVDIKDYFTEGKTRNFISSSVLDDEATITEKDGSIIVSCVSDMDDIAIIGEGVVSCVETYTLDAKTREMTAVKTVYTYDDGTVEEGIVTITRDAEIPEGMKAFIAYDQENENLRTVTVVSNPGTENEKTESVQLPKGVFVSVSADWEIEETYTMYTDAACTQIFEGELDTSADLTIYIKWGE